MAMYELLKGLRIVEGASFVAAPLCGLTFVQLGADVIRFDPIGGGPDFGRWPLASSGLSFYWEGLNKGKRSIAIDLGRPPGREIAIALITAPGTGKGCFVTNYPASGFLSHSELTKRRSDLITARIVGSSDGRTALDYTINCATGYPEMTGPPQHTGPVNHVLPAWDLSAGLTAAVSLLAALRSRETTGQGTEVQVPLSNVAFSALSMLGNIGEASVRQIDRERYGNAMYGSFGRDFETADGRRFMVVAITKRQWTGLVAALGLQADISALEREHGVDFLNDEGARFRLRDALFSRFEREIRQRDSQQLANLFDHHAVCWGPYQSVVEGLGNDPRLSEANPMFERISHPSGETYIAAGYPGCFSGLDRVSVRPAPTLGANTEEVLAEELGMSQGEIARLHDEKIVSSA
jgi:2-methylfumaryl-CoA isomerase